MLSKKVIKDIQSLGHKKHRSEMGLFIAEGPKVVEEVINTVPDKIEHIYATANWCRNNPLAPRVTEVSDIELERISQLPTPNTVICVARQFEVRKPTAVDFALYLDTIQDPGNLGTIIRIADWFGVNDVICSEGCADVYNPKVIQATMGSIGRVHVYYDRDNNWLSDQHCSIYAAVLNGESIYEVDYIKKGILVIGNEAHGLSPDVLLKATKKITIPRMGKAESLNAAVATGVILSHLLK